MDAFPHFGVRSTIGPLDVVYGITAIPPHHNKPNQFYMCDAHAVYVLDANLPADDPKQIRVVCAPSDDVTREPIFCALRGLTVHPSSVNERIVVTDFVLARVHCIFSDGQYSTLLTERTAARGVAFDLSNRYPDRAKVGNPYLYVLTTESDILRYDFETRMI